MTCAKDSAGPGGMSQRCEAAATKRLGAAQRLKGRNRVRRLEKGLAPVAGEPRVRLERAAVAASNTDHDARVVPRAAEQEREHRSAAQAAMAPDPLAAMQNPVDVKGELRRSHALTARRNAGEPCEGAIGREELERARHRGARSHDLELGAQPHASEPERRSPRAAAVRHFWVYVGAFASAETMKPIHMPLGACPGTPHAITYWPAGEALNVV
jgi:hypothetical protein